MIATALFLLLHTTTLTSPASGLDRHMVDGWTQAGMAEAFAQAGLSDIVDSTADPNFPAITGRTRQGFPVQAVFMACDHRPPQPDDTCSGIFIAVAIPATEMRWAEIIVGSLEPDVVGFNASILPGRDANNQPNYSVSIGHYLVTDGGVGDGLAAEYLRRLIGLSDQTADFMLSDDPAHAQLWRLDQ
ncbi:hypothetical protein [Maricaulis sp.]|uniref:hypothetical protein n=1 Tax=Maricaulis sp. TaxID=1486257 RepID=UPI003A8EB33F